MSYCEIISTLYESQDLCDCIKKLVKEKYRDDFRQELFIILLDMPEEKVTELYNNKVLKYFVVRICLNLVRQKRNVYHKKYLLHESYNADYAWQETLVSDTIDISDRIIYEQKERQLCDHIETDLESVFGTHYYKSLVKLIAEKGSMREVSRQTRIPVSSISESVKRVRLHLQSFQFNTMINVAMNNIGNIKAIDYSPIETEALKLDFEDRINLFNLLAISIDKELKEKQDVKQLSEA